MLVTLSGQAHDIFTGVAIRSAQIESVFSVQTTVEFWSLTENEIKWYVATGEPFGKAEGYAIHFVYQSNQRGLLQCSCASHLPSCKELKMFNFYHNQ